MSEQSMIESLEARQFFSANSLSVNSPFPSLTNGVLNIAGTDKADHITVTRVSTQTPAAGKKSAIILNVDGDHVVSYTYKSVQGAAAVTTVPATDHATSGGYLRVDTQDEEFFIPAAGIKSINVNAGAGNDYVEITKSVALQTTLNGGAGDDTLGGGTKHDLFFGGAGNDLLFSGTGTAGDTFDNSIGNDVIATNGPDTQGSFRVSQGQITGSFAKLKTVIDLYSLYDSRR